MTIKPDRPTPWTCQYDSWVPQRLQYVNEPLAHILDKASDQKPNDAALWFLGERFTFEQLRALSERFADALDRLGVRQGDRVAIMLPNCPQYVFCVYGVLRLGAVVVNLNPAYTARELRLILEDSGARVIVVVTDRAPLVLPLLATQSLDHVIVTALHEYSAEKTVPPPMPGVTMLHELVSGEGATRRRRAINSAALALLQYTGGTSGKMKAAMLTHDNIFASVVQTESFVGPALSRQGRSYLMVLPYFHIYGFVIGVMRAIWIGAAQIILPKFEIESVLSAIRDFQPTNFPAVPTVFAALLNCPNLSDFGVDKVTAYSTGGAPCPPEILDKWEKLTGTKLRQGFGLTESSAAAIMSPEVGPSRPGSIGVPIRDTYIKIVDVETGGRELPIGEAGELCVAGPQVMRGYWRQPEETDYALRHDSDGRTWLHTGDIARMDSDGFVTIVGRKKNVVIVDAFKVYPAEVEAVLCEHPAVRSATVSGAPNRYHGEIVHASVVVRESMTVSARDLIDHCRSALAAYKVPRVIVIKSDLPSETQMASARAEAADQEENLQ